MRFFGLKIWSYVLVLFCPKIFILFISQSLWMIMLLHNDRQFTQKYNWQVRTQLNASYVVLYHLWNHLNYDMLLFAGDSTYANKRQKLSNHWDLIQPLLQKAFYTSRMPLTSKCVTCEEDSDLIIQCPDCGPCAYYCHECCDRIHKYAPLHIPLKWQVNTNMIIPVFFVPLFLKKFWI